MASVAATSGVATVPAQARARSLWRQVAVPSEHGGWSLTAEPVVLGLVVAWSWPGLALGLAAILAFVAHTPVKVVLVDRWRHRWLERSRLAARIAAVELAMIGVLVALAATGAVDRRFWVPLAVAVPFVGVESWFDMRSRSRRLIPELAGTFGIGSVVAAIVLTGGGSALLAVGLWVVVSARAAAAIPYARTQVFRAHGRPVTRWHSDAAQVAAVAAVALAWGLDAIPLAPAIVVTAIAGFNVMAVRGPAKPAVVIGLQQMAFGIGVVVAPQWRSSRDRPDTRVRPLRRRHHTLDDTGDSTMTMIDSRATLAALVTARPALAAALDRVGLDYCCGGRRTLADAAHEAGLDLDTVVENLTELTSLSGADPVVAAEDWTAMSPGELVDHLEVTHHAYLREALPRATTLADKVASVHGERHPELHLVARLVTELRAELEPHLAKEERILFPMIRELAAATHAPQFHCGSLANPIRVMGIEHDHAGELLSHLRAATAGYTVPDDGCASYQALYTALAELEADTHLHVHKENNLLFPAVLAAEATLGGSLR